MGLLQIYEGWRNKLLPPEELKEAIKETVEKRMTICNDCPFISTKHKTSRPDVHCTDCGCTLSAKTACLSCECPKGKWLAEVSEEQLKQFKDGQEDNID